MTNQHPITPPPELVQQWCHEEGDEIKTSPRCYQIVATKAARWGADQELEACCKCLTLLGCSGTAAEVRAARRPKPPSLKEQGLDALREAESTGCLYVNGRSDLIRRALEALPND
jgi:hypothetical protein